MLLIEEKAKIFRRDIKFNIPRHPIQALKKIDRAKILLIIQFNIKNGINFCQVLKIKKVSQDTPSLTSGNQKKIGNRPSFVKRANLKVL